MGGASFSSVSDGGESERTKALRSSSAEVDRQAAMDAPANRQEGRAVGVVWFGAARTFDDCCHGNDNAKQKDPQAKQPGHDP